MRGSSLTTFLMFLPLIAIPLLAIFGVPEFTPVNASAPEDSKSNAIAIDDRARKSPASFPVGGDSNGNRDVFSPIDPESNVAPGFPGQGLKTEADPFLNSRPTDDGSRKTKKQGLNGWEVDDGRGSSQLATNGRKPLSPETRTGTEKQVTTGAALHSVASTPDTETGFTWRKAVRTLNRMGIKDFLLQPGTRSEEFHFSCVYSSPDNPRVAHRFEAEDPDPLQAVQKVLKQIQSRQ